MTAVVTDVRYRMSLALIRDLGGRGVRVVGCEKEGQDRPVGACSRYCARFRALPDGGYLDALYELCRETAEREREKPALLPVGAATLAALAEPGNARRFRAVCGLLIPEKAALDALNDKEAVAGLGRELGIPTPEEFTISSAVFPCVVKPRCGERFGLAAAQRYAVCRDRGALEAACERFRALTGEEPVIQRYLTGGGMGCSVIAEKGAVRRCLCHRRIREYPVSGGPSTCAQALREPRLEAYAARLMERTGFSGPCMVEFKLDGDGTPYLLEVNPRVWGTYPLTRAAGADFSGEWFRLAYNEGNPERALPPAEAALKEGRKMTFTASDLAAAAGYWRAGQRKRALGAVGDLLNPAVADGVWEWRDPRPAVRYYQSLLRRGGK